MAISWGAWEYSGGNGMRVGLDVSWEAISNTETAATCTVEIWTENQFTYSDSQTLNPGGSIDGNINFTNNQGGSPVKRGERTYTYTYPSTSYGTSPGTRTFSAALSGAYNGVTPSKSVTSSIPARPIAAPAAPSNVAMSRVSDTSTTVTWTRNATSGKPYETQTVQKSINGGAWATISSPSGSASSLAAATAANQKLRFQVRANNDAGSSSFVASSAYIYTSPAVPTAPSRADIAGPGQQVTWANTGMGYTEYVTEIIGYKNGASVGVLGTVASGGTTFDHLTSHATQPYTTSDRWKYTVRHKTSSGTALYSAETAATTETAGVTSPPNAPTGLSPNGGVIDPTEVNAFTWAFNTTDSSDQSQFQIRHRLQGAGSWTTGSVVTSSAKSWNLPANTYTNGNVIEWQVTTKGADATWSPWSASAFVTAFVTKLIVPRWNVGMGEMQVDVAGHDWIVVGSGGSAPAFQGTWINYGAPYRSASFCRRAGFTVLGGLVKSGAAGSTIFTLPVGYRPAASIIVDAIVNAVTDGSVAVNDIAIRLNIGSDGTVTHYTTGMTASTGYVSLEGIMFVAEL